MRLVIALALAATLSACAAQPAPKAADTTANSNGTATRISVPELENKPLAELEQMVAVGHIKAHVELASRYGVGVGVKQDYEKAAQLLRIAVDKNDPDAEFLLGMLNNSGLGVPENKTAAVMLFERAAQQNHPLGTYWMGVMIFSGQGGISPTWAGAVPYFWRAANQGVADAQFMLGFAYDHGEDVDRNVKQAAYWYRRTLTTDPKHPKALFSLRALIEKREIDWQAGDPGAPPAAPLNAPAS